MVLLVYGVAGRRMLDGGDIVDVKTVTGELEVCEFWVFQHAVEFVVEFQHPVHASFGFVVDRFLPEVLPLRVHRHSSRHGDGLCVLYTEYTKTTRRFGCKLTAIVSTMSLTVMKPRTCLWELGNELLVCKFCVDMRLKFRASHVLVCLASLRYEDECDNFFFK